jgi:prephenate dehydrogenase
MQRIAIVGFGLIGASVALAARARWPALQVTAIDRGEVLEAGRARAIATAYVDTTDRTARRRAFEEAELSILATPIAEIEAVLPEAVAACPLVTDCGSTKRSIVAVARRSLAPEHFVAGHPMAGKPIGGTDVAEEGLFRGRPWILCTETSAPTAVQHIRCFIEELGAIPALMTAEAHDRAVALTSHVPQLLASALLVAAERAKIEAAAHGPGFQSATRVGGGSDAMWKDIFSRNADCVASSIDALVSELTSIATELRKQPAETAGALALLERAREIRRKS